MIPGQNPDLAKTETAKPMNACHGLVGIYRNIMLNKKQHSSDKTCLIDKFLGRETRSVVNILGQKVASYASVLYVGTTPLTPSGKQTPVWGTNYLELHRVLPMFLHKTALKGPCNGNAHLFINSRARQERTLFLTSAPPTAAGSVGLSHLRLPPRLTTPVAAAASSAPLSRASKLDPDLGAGSRSPAAEELTIPWVLEPLPPPLRPRLLPPPPPPPAPLLLWLLPLPPRLLLPPLLPLSGVKRPPPPLAPPPAKERIRRRG